MDDDKDPKPLSRGSFLRSCLRPARRDDLARDALDLHVLRHNHSGSDSPVIRDGKDYAPVVVDVPKHG